MFRQPLRAIPQFCVAALLLFPAAGLASDPPPPPRAALAARARGGISLDGRLTEEAWAIAPVIGDFVQRDPDEGEPATERTEVRLVYDDDALWVGARLHDHQANGIVRRLSRRDSDSTADLFCVYLDPHHDHKTGVLLRVSADGSLADSWLSNDFGRDSSWDGVWDARTGVDAEGWTVEMRIPFSQLRFSPGDRQTWGLNLSRSIARKHEEDWWVLVPKNDMRLVSAFGHVSGLDGLTPRRHVELLPYATTSLMQRGTAVAADPLNRATSFMGGAGLDLKWGLTSSFTFDGTVNPDFGQVEVDPAVVNLTAFETFYQEKRPFFIEGSQQFSTFGRNGLLLYGRFGATYPSMWYSRRIGRSPHLAPDGEFVRQPPATTILGAAKLTGRTASGWTMSFLDAVTGREWAHVSNGGVRTTREVEPLTNYAAARVSRDLGGRGTLGLLATAVNRNVRTGALRNSVTSSAYAAGLDANVFLDPKKVWVLSGSFAGSHVSGDEAAIARLQRASARYYQRPDATHVRLDPSARALSGWAGQINVNRTRGNLLVDGALWAVSPGFESNDVGFSPQADRIGAHTGWIWQKTNPDRWTRDRSLTVLSIWLWNTAGDNLANGYNVQGSATLNNYWSVSAGGEIDLPRMDDRATRGGPLVRRPIACSQFVSVSTDRRKRLAFQLSSSHDSNTAGGWLLSANPALVVRPSSSVTLSAGPDLTRNHAVAQYVTALDDPTALATYGRRTVFSTLDQTEVSMVTRLNVVFTPRASLEVYAQPLLSSGRFSTLKEFARPRTFDFTRYGIDAGTIGYDAASRVYSIDPDGAGPAPGFHVADPNYNYASLRVNAVFRWEWRLGSTLYAVWTQQREDAMTSGEFNFGHDMQSMARAPGDHVFMVKLAYWLSR